ncbi:hypothetical protein EEL31_10420 [Brevibacillus laterosporus]|nr:hypothetical protein [Brevibacillus laterosporus]TPG68903.1 hypothetical protein EEL31_10420 [Brevibacillus laterosporus]
MKKLELLSPNLESIIKEVTTNQQLCKLIYYTQVNPLDQPDIKKTSSLIMKNIFPYPFDLETTEKDCVQLRVSYPEVEIQNRTIENTSVLFEIALSKNLWSIAKNDETSLRPFEIMSELVNHFRENSKGKVGILIFSRARFVKYNSKFNGYELYARMMTIGTGR